MNLEFSHTTRESLLDKDAFITALVNRLSENEKSKILAALQQTESPNR